MQSSVQRMGDCMFKSTGRINRDYRRKVDRLMWTAAAPHIALCMVLGFFSGGLVTWGFMLSVVPLAALVTTLWPGRLASGMAMATLFMGLSALLIFQMHGMIEAHFSVFIMLPVLILYCDWRVLHTGAIVIAIHHCTFAYLQHLGVVQVFANVAPTDSALILGRLAIHVGAVLAQEVVLIYLAYQLLGLIGDSLATTAFAHRAEQGRINTVFSPAQRKRPTIAAIASMQEKLSAALRHVGQSASAVHAISRDTSSAQQTLQQQSQRSAAQIERIAASSEELSQTTRQSAAEARQTHALAAETGDTVQQGADSVGRLRDTMAQIDTSAREIADLLGEIDNINFQTNLLALNASVEAARAGQHGRGFAVVANEVRNLSQRTGKAAQTIRARVDQSNQQIKTGVGEVQTTETLMQKVVAAFVQVTDRMDGINTTSRQQQQGIETLNAGILEMQEALALSDRSIDQTQQAAARLEAQGDRLIDAVGYFELEPDDPMRADEHGPRRAVSNLGTNRSSDRLIVAESV